MKKIFFNYNFSRIDSISKFNLFNKNLLPNLESLIIFSKLSINDSNFLRDFFFLSKLFFFWFNKKISILQVISEKKGGSNKGKKSLTFFFGCTLRKNFLFKNLDYLNSIVFDLTKKIDSNIKYKKLTNGLLYSFSNINYLLGFKSERFFNLNLKINILYNFSSNKKASFKKINFKIINFYEKVFF